MREPSAAREKRVEEVGSKEREESLNKSKPAKEPARPTWPIRLKSILGKAAETKREGERNKREKAKKRKDVGVGRHDDEGNVIVCGGGEEAYAGEK